ncbi:MAG: Ig-like domain-containing protein [Verrucomicrobia bacterium]|nr:Ig-like domain-containing protein [Verrucomicrobiota bacterium]
MTFDFGIHGPAAIDQDTAQITITVPPGTSLDLAPTFALSPGATCDHTSGDTYDFSVPVSYNVTGSDSSSRAYTVTVTVIEVGFTETDLDTSATATGLEIQNDGTLVRAYRYGETGTITVNGLTFQGASGAGNDSALSGTWGGSGYLDWWIDKPPIIADSDYLHLTGCLLQAPADTTGTKPTLTIGGLTVGHTYRLQMFSNSPRGGEAEVEGVSSTIQTGDHKFVMLTATWTAADDTLDMRWISQSTAGEPVHFSAYALHDITAGGSVDAANSTVAASPDTVSNDGTAAATITVTLLDAGTTPVAGKTVTLESSRGATDTISAASGSSNASGVVTFTVTSTTAGSPVFTATDVTDGNLVIAPSTATVTFSATAVSPLNSTVEASPGSVANDGTLSTITVTLKGTSGTPVAGKTVTLASSRGETDTISGASGASDVNGVVTFTVSSLTAGTPVFTATDVDDGLTLSPTATVTFTSNVSIAVTGLDTSAGATGLEIQSDGTLVRAIYYGGYNIGWGTNTVPPLPAVGDASVTVNGVTFQNGGTPGGSVADTAWFGGYNGCYIGAIAAPTDYNWSLLIGAQLLTAANPWGLTISGLTPGHTYRLQLLGDTITGTVEGEAFALGSTPQMLTATWTAKAGDTTLDVASSSFAHVTGYALHDITGGTGSDYDTWAAGFPGYDLTDPAGDADNDGLTNGREYPFGLDPTSGTSVNPITVPFDAAAGTFSYTRRNPTLTQLIYTVMISKDLQNWVANGPGGSQTPDSESAGLQTVAVQVDATPLDPSDGKLFVRVQAE